MATDIDILDFVSIQNVTKLKSNVYDYGLCLQWLL